MGLLGFVGSVVSTVGNAVSNFGKSTGNQTLANVGKTISNVGTFVSNFGQPKNQQQNNINSSNSGSNGGNSNNNPGYQTSKKIKRKKSNIEPDQDSDIGEDVGYTDIAGRWQRVTSTVTNTVRSGWNRVRETGTRYAEYSAPAEGNPTGQEVALIMAVEGVPANKVEAQRLIASVAAADLDWSEEDYLAAWAVVNAARGKFNNVNNFRKDNSAPISMDPMFRGSGSNDQLPLSEDSLPPAQRPPLVLLTGIPMTDVNTFKKQGWMNYLGEKYGVTLSGDGWSFESVYDVYTQTFDIAQRLSQLYIELNQSYSSFQLPNIQAIQNETERSQAIFTQLFGPVIINFSTDSEMSNAFNFSTAPTVEELTSVYGQAFFKQDYMTGQTEMRLNNTSWLPDENLTLYDTWRPTWLTEGIEFGDTFNNWVNSPNDAASEQALEQLIIGGLIYQSNMDIAKQLLTSPDERLVGTGLDIIALASFTGDMQLSDYQDALETAFGISVVVTGEGAPTPTHSAFWNYHQGAEVMAQWLDAEVITDDNRYSVFHDVFGHIIINRTTEGQDVEDSYGFTSERVRTIFDRFGGFTNPDFPRASANDMSAELFLHELTHLFINSAGFGEFQYSPLNPTEVGNIIGEFWNNAVEIIKNDAHSGNEEDNRDWERTANILQNIATGRFDDGGSLSGLIAATILVNEVRTGTLNNLSDQVGGIPNPEEYVWVVPDNSNTEDGINMYFGSSGNQVISGVFPNDNVYILAQNNSRVLTAVQRNNMWIIGWVDKALVESYSASIPDVTLSGTVRDLIISSP